MFINIVGRLFSILTGYFTIFLITNNYSFSIYGEYTMFIVYSSLAVTLGVFGVNKSIIAHDEMDFKSNTSLKLLMIIIHVAFSLVVCSVFLNFYDIDNILYFYLSVIMMVISEILKTFFLLHSHNKTYSIVSYSAQQVTFLLVLCMSLIYSLNLSLIEIVVISYFFSLNVAMFFVFKLRVFNFTFRVVDIPLLFVFYRSSISFVALNFIQILSESIDKILIEKFLSNADVGIFSVLDKISRLSVAAFNAMSPIMMRKTVLHKNKESLYSHYSSLVVAVCLPITFSLVFFYEPILSLFDKELLPYFNVFVVLLLVRLLQYSTGFKAVLLQMGGLKNYDIISNVIKASVYITLMIILVSYFGFGLYGVVISLFISILMSSLSQVYFINKKYKVKYFQKTFYYLFPAHLLIYFISLKLGFTSMIIFEVL